MSRDVRVYAPTWRGVVGRQDARAQQAVRRSAVAIDKAERHAIDPLAEQAATLLAKAMVTSHDRDELWQAFRDRVVQQAKALEEAPVREALEEMERRGLSLDVVARVVHEKLAD
jgi:hypothetical protein